MAVDLVTCVKSTVGLDPSCAALEQPGGVNKRFWAAKRDTIDMATAVITNGMLVSFSMKQTVAAVVADPEAEPPVVGVDAEYYPLNKFIGKRDKHDFGVTATKGDNGVTYTQMGKPTLYGYTHAERQAIENLFKEDDLVIFVQTNAGQVKAYGWGIGINGTTYEQKEGILLTDPTSYVLNMEGLELASPLILNASGSTLAANIAYLNAKNGTAA